MRSDTKLLTYISEQIERWTNDDAQKKQNRNVKVVKKPMSRRKKAFQILGERKNLPPNIFKLVALYQGSAKSWKLSHGQVLRAVSKTKILNVDVGLQLVHVDVGVVVLVVVHVDVGVVVRVVGALRLSAHGTNVKIFFPG